MSKLVPISLGVLCLILEITLFRELFVLLEGSEFVIGWMYLVWFVFSGIGAMLFKDWRSRYPRRTVDLWFISVPYILLAFLIIIEVIRLSPRFAIGRPPCLYEAMLIIAGILALPALVSGVGFSLVSSWLGDSRWVFSLETLGFGIGSVIVALLLFFTSLSMYQIAVIGILLAGWLLCKRYRPSLVAMVLVCPAVFLATFSSWQEYWSLTERGKVVMRKDSPLGRVEVRRLKGQQNLFYNGKFISDFQLKMFSELSAHPACLQLDNYDAALVIGDMGKAVVREVAKYPFKKILLVEEDPVIQDLLKKQYSNIPNLHVLSIRKLLKLTGNFSYIFIGYTDPLTLAQSRYLSREFLERIRQILQPEGIVAIPVYGDMDFMSKELMHYTAVVFSTVKGGFSHVRYLSGSPAVFLCSPRRIFLNKQFFNERLQQKQIATKYFSPYYWDVLLDPLRLSLQEESIRVLAEENRRESTLYQPAVFDHFFSFYLYRMDRPLWRLWPIWKSFSLGLFLLLLFGLPIGCWVWKRRSRFFSIGLSSFIHMSLYLVVVLWMQMVHGTFYGDLAVLTGLYMVGLGVGSRFLIPSRLYWRVLPGLGLLLGLLVFLFPIRYLVFMFVLLQSLLQGAFLGYQMQYVGSGGQVYFWDLLGAGIAAFLIGPGVVVSLGIDRLVIILLIGIGVASMTFAARKNVFLY